MHMQFGEDSQHNFFFSQPHQPFFVLAFVNAFVTMLIVLLSYNGIIHLAVSTVGFHIYALTYLVLTPAFLAFLFTTFPKFTSTPALERTHYIRIFSLFYMGVCHLSSGKHCNSCLFRDRRSDCIYRTSYGCSCTEKNL